MTKKKTKRRPIIAPAIAVRLLKKDTHVYNNCYELRSRAIKNDDQRNISKLNLQLCRYKHSYKHQPLTSGKLLSNNRRAVGFVSS